MLSKFIIEGGLPLKGEIIASGSKNAALPIIAATLLSKEKSVIRNVPDIGDIHTFLKILDYLNVKTVFKDNILTIDPSKLENKDLPRDYVKKLRASILLLSPLLVRNKEVLISYPGGCVLGKRPVDIHLKGLISLGARVVRDDNRIHLKLRKLKGADIIMSEMSVTATENVIMAAVLAKGKTSISLAAAEPHVADLCLFLRKMGAKIKGIGTNFLEIKGITELKGVKKYTVTSDYLEIGTLAIAVALTNGNVLIKNVEHRHLDIFWQRMREVKVNFKLGKKDVHILPTKRKFKAIRKLRTGVFPAFPTDLHPPFAVLLSQSKGVSRVFETLFEGRLSYLFELEKLGANVEVLNPHQALIIGPTPLKGTNITSCDIRAGAAMVLAALVAKGQTEIADINYIERGYEDLDGKLRLLGAKIERI